MAKEKFLGEEENQHERELHNWWESLGKRNAKETKPRQKESLAAEVAVGMEPKLSENNRKQIQWDFKMYDAHTKEVLSEKWPKIETDQARMYKSEWEDWEFCKNQVSLYSEKSQKIKETVVCSGVSLVNFRKFIRSKLRGILTRMRLKDFSHDNKSEKSEHHYHEIRKWYLWRASYLKCLIRFRYIDFGNKFVLNIENLNEFEQLVLKIMNATEKTKPKGIWKILADELKNRKYDSENILSHWEPDLGSLSSRTIYWQTPRNDPRPVSYSTFQRKILLNLRKVKKTFTR